jgi:hypothetical protein
MAMQSARDASPSKSAEDDLGKLGKWVEKPLSGCKVRKAKIDSFGLVFRLGKKVIWERPVTGGDMSAIAIQGTCQGKDPLTVDGLLVWIEKFSPVNATMHFHRKKIAELLESEFGIDSFVPLGRWHTLSKSLVKTGAIEISSSQQGKQTTNEVIPIVITHLQRMVIDEKIQEIAAPKAQREKPKDDAKRHSPTGRVNLFVRLGY